MAGEAQLDFKLAVITYLSEYLSWDLSAINALKSTDLTEDAKCKILGDWMTEYGIARNFPVNLSEPCRHARLLSKVLEIEPPADTVSAIEKVNEAIESFRQLARQRNIVSASSKLLWLRFQAPILVYDSKVCDWLYSLGTFQSGDYGNYGRFSVAWHQQYALCRVGITDTCTKLARTGLHELLSDRLPQEDFFELCESDLFRYRVFDHAILNLPK